MLTKLVNRKSITLMLVIGLMTMAVFGAGCSSGSKQPADSPQQPSSQPDNTQQEKPGLPAMMTWSTYDTSGAGYIQATAIANALTTNEGVKIRTIPSGTSIGRMYPLKDGQAGYAFLADESYFATEGLYEFAEKDWGPQDLRAILSHPASIAMAVTKESGVQTIADLRGKRVAWIPGASTLNVKGTAFLAFGGLTWDDVERVEMASYGAALKGLIEGQVDAAVSSPNASPLHELAASAKGLHFPEFPAEDTEGWARMSAVAPWLFPYKEDLGAGLTRGEPIELAGYSYPVLVTYADTPADEVYALIKAIDENFDFYENADILMPLWEISLAGRTPSTAPYHEGAIRYLKEKGLWTSEDDAWNEERIARLNTVKQAWQEVVKEADSQGISDKDFPDFWLAKRPAAGE